MDKCKLNLLFKGVSSLYYQFDFLVKIQYKLLLNNVFYMKIITKWLKNNKTARRISLRQRKG